MSGCSRFVYRNIERLIFWKLYRNENYYNEWLKWWFVPSMLCSFRVWAYWANVLADGSSVCFFDWLWTDVDLLYSIWRSNYWWVNFAQCKFKNFPNSSLKKDIPGSLQYKMLNRLCLCNITLRTHSPCCTWPGTCWELCTWTLRN